MSNPDAHVLDDFEDIFPKLKHSLFGINKFIKQIQKWGKLNGIVVNKINDKDTFTDEVGMQN